MKIKFYFSSPPTSIKMITSVGVLMPSNVKYDHIRKLDKNLQALTGTLRTMPREINVGYVIAMPKFNRMLKAVERSSIRAKWGYQTTK